MTKEEKRLNKEYYQQKGKAESEDKEDGRSKGVRMCNREFREQTNQWRFPIIQLTMLFVAEKAAVE